MLNEVFFSAGFCVKAKGEIELIAIIFTQSCVVSKEWKRAKKM
jgi:hypothetical protein